MRRIGFPTLAARMLFGIEKIPAPAQGYVAVIWWSRRLPYYAVSRHKVTNARGATTFLRFKAEGVSADEIPQASGQPLPRP